LERLIQKHGTHTDKEDELGAMRNATVRLLASTWRTIRGLPISPCRSVRAVPS